MQKSRFLDRSTPPHIATLVLIPGLAALCMNIFLPSLPSMAIYFNTDYSMMQLVISGYLAATAVTQLFVGALSDLYGRRPVLLTCIGIMILASGVCLFATSYSMFMFGRIAQASIVSGFVLSRAIVRDMVPANEAASMIGYVTMGMSVVPMFSPALGGFLESVASWHASFYLVISLGILIFVIAYFDLGETNKNKSGSFTQQFYAWPELLSSKIFWGYALTATFSSALFFVFLGGAPYIGAVIYELSPSMLGIMFFFMAAGYMIGNFISGRYATKIGITKMMLAGNIISAAGIFICYLIALSDTHHYLAFFLPLATIGLGNGVTLPSANAGMISVKPHLAGSASGLGGAINIGIGAVLSVYGASLLTKETGVIPIIYLLMAVAILAIIASRYIIVLQRGMKPNA